MKKKIAYTLLALGLVTLLAQVLHRIQRDAVFYERQLKLREASIEEGLDQLWRQFLLDEARAGRLEKTYSLRWSRDGYRPSVPFFPLQPARMDWAGYRRNVAEKQTEKIREFLSTAMQATGSWDRALAVEEWLRVDGTLPTELSPFERSRINAEARAAYRLIFAQFEGGYELPLVTREASLKTVFLQSSGEGDIEAYLPSIESLQNSQLPRFLKANDLTNARFDESALSVRFARRSLPNPSASILEAGLLILSFLLLAAGGVVIGFALRDDQKRLLKRVSFLNQIVHEIKTPLAGLKLHTQLIKRAGPTEQGLQAIEDSVTRIDRLFDDIVFLNRPEIRAAPALTGVRELNALVLELKREFGSRVQFAGEFTCDLETDVPRLNMILRNLIRNAIKYGENARVRINTEETFVLIVVEDEGPGVPASEAKLVFDEFYRTETHRQSHPDGLGLGLAICRKLATELGASFWLDNPGEPGARFVLKLSRIHKRGAN